MDENNMFNAIDENGVESTYKMLYYKSVDNEPIIWYTDGTLDENGKHNIYISSYVEKDKVFLLDSIDDEEKMEQYINIFKNEISGINN